MLAITTTSDRHRLHRDVAPVGVGDVAEQQPLDLLLVRRRQDDETDRQHPDEEQPDARVVTDRGASIDEADPDHEERRR